MFYYLISFYIPVILILAVTFFVFANSIETNTLNPSIAYGKNKVFSKPISYTTAGNNLEQPSSLVTQQSAGNQYHTQQLEII